MGKGIKFGSAVCVIAAAFWACGDDSASPDVDIPALGSSTSENVEPGITSGTSSTVEPNSSGTAVDSNNSTPLSSGAAVNPGTPEPLNSGTCGFYPDKVGANGKAVEFGLNKIFGWEDNIPTPEATFAVVREGEKFSKTLNNLGTYQFIEVTAPKTAGTYEYSLMYEDKVVCTASLTVREVTATCGAGDDPAEVFAGKSVSLNERILGIQGLSADLTEVEVLNSAGTSLGKGSCTSLSCNVPIKVPEALGEFDYALKIDGTEKCKGKLKATELKFNPDCHFNDWKDYGKAGGWEFGALPNESGLEFEVTLIKDDMDDLLKGTSFTLSVTGNGITTSDVVKDGSGSIKITTPSTVGTYTYTLKNGDEEICSAELNVHELQYNCVDLNGTLGEPKYVSSEMFTGITNKKQNRKIVLGNESKTDGNCNVGYCQGMDVKLPQDVGEYEYEFYVDDFSTPKCTGKAYVKAPKITAGSCGISGNKFNLGSFSGWEWYAPGDLPMTLSGTDGSSMDITVGHYYNGGFGMSLPTESGTYTYTLTYDIYTVCSFEYTVP